MDALMLMNTAGRCEAREAISAQLTEVLGRARVADGVVIYVEAPTGMAADQQERAETGDAAAAPEAPAGSGEDPAPEVSVGSGEDPAPEVSGGLGARAEDLILSSPQPDAFDGVDDLAAGLHDLSVDRIIIGGLDCERAAYHTAMAGLACSFDVVLLADGLADCTGAPVDWLDDAAADGAAVSAAADLWLRM